MGKAAEKGTGASAAEKDNGDKEQVDTEVKTLAAKAGFRRVAARTISSGKVAANGKEAVNGKVAASKNI